MKYIFFLFLFSLFLGCKSGRTYTSEVGEGWAKTSVNATIFRKNSLVSDKNYQYIAYYDSAGFVTLGKRNHNSPDWSLNTTQYKGNVWDAHNIISIMVDGDGYLHVSWDHHDNPLNYARSLAPGSIELGEKEQMVGHLEDNGVTYPEFYALPDGGMFFVYRYGASGDGNIVLNRYNLQEKKWVRIHDNLVTGEGKRNAYWQMAVDNNGAIHLSYVWRDTWDVATNHNMCYAKSVDGGVSWHTSYGRALDIPISYETSEVAIEIPQRSNLINQTAITTDAAGNPAIASYWTMAEHDVTQFFVIYHNGHQWSVSQASERKTPFSLAGGGTRRIPVSRPQLLTYADNGNTYFYLVYRDEEVANRIVLCQGKLVSDSIIWKQKVVDDLYVGQWEPSFDTELWRNSSVLSLFIQKVGQGDGGEKAVELEPQMVKVFQLNSKQLKAFFK
jgi:hypothetical protein